MSVKVERIENLLVKEISNVIASEVDNPAIGFISITAVRTSSDLDFARVYFNVYDITKKDSTEQALNNSSAFIRKIVSEKVDLRHVPQLKFIYDESLDYSNNIESIIEKLNENKWFKTKRNCFT